MPGNLSDEMPVAIVDRVRAYPEVAAPADQFVAVNLWFV
jgi:hypothetical protein